MSIFKYPFRVEEGPENMAIDMWLLSKANIFQGTIFRRYGWNSDQITFGYGQKADWVEGQIGKGLSMMTRRPTGGGIVRHGNDLTYCLVVPRGSTWEKMPPMQFYALIHQQWAFALKEFGVISSLMPCPKQTKGGIPGDCFSEPVGQDLMNEIGNQKIGGAAMKRTRLGMLMQGTLNLSQFEDLNHGDLEKSFLVLLADKMKDNIYPKEWPLELLEVCLDQIKMFRSTEWNRDRKSC